MQFLIDKLNKHQVDPDGVEVYTNLSARQILHVDPKAGRAVLRVGEVETVLLRNGAGQWVPADNDWGALAKVLSELGLVLAPFGF